jgi:hypothetical protein
MASAPASPPRAAVCVVEVVKTIFGGGEKEALTTVLLVIVKTQVPIPVQAVLSQPMKYWFASGAAERVTAVA